MHCNNIVNKIQHNFEDFEKFFVVWRSLFFVPCWLEITFFLFLLLKNTLFVFSAGFRRSFRLSRKDKKTNKSMYECKKSEQYDTADVPTYEEVTPYRRQTNEKYRLVVLVGECLLSCVTMIK